MRHWFCFVSSALSVPLRMYTHRNVHGYNIDTNNATSLFYSQRVLRSQRNVQCFIRALVYICNIRFIMIFIHWVELGCIGNIQISIQDL